MNFHLYPSYATEEVLTFIKLAANQPLILTNFEYFFSSTMFLDPKITISHDYKSLLMVIEVNLNDFFFELIYDALNLCYLKVRIKGVAFSEYFFWYIPIVTDFFLCPCLTFLTVRKAETECHRINPFHFN